MGTTNFDTVVATTVQNSEGALHPSHYELLTFFIAGNQSASVKKAGAIVPFAASIVDVRAYVDTAPATTSLIIDVNKNGTTVFTTQGNRPTIAAAGNASTTTLPDVTAVAAGDRITFDIDAVGTGTVGADLYLTIALKRANVA